ncbi:MAG: HPP family protein [Gammaproteobacteria bacterium]|nr:HPP family protein [Gammaproteobacteria bacterium]MCH9744155.1 HPP family protein [Gammaproteobacteria bacterium]
MSTEHLAHKKKIQHHGWHVLIQTLCAVIFILGVLYIFNLVSTSELLWAVGSGALSSSSYVVFGQPHTRSGRPSHIISGYIIGMFSGELIRLVIMYSHPLIHIAIGLNVFYIYAALAALSVGLSLYLMTFFKVTHPPAAGMALVLVLDMRDYRTLVVIIAAAFLLSLIRHIFRKQLINLS